MGESIFETTQVVPRPLDEVFDFFADAYNLERITPPFLRFAVLTPAPIEMAPGTLIDYRLRLHGIPIRWRTEITAWEPPHRFVDEQRRGPYRQWIHTHTFRETSEGTSIADRVAYVVPGGSLIDRLFVRRDVERIFGFRQDAIENILG